MVRRKIYTEWSKNLIVQYKVMESLAIPIGILVIKADRKDCCVCVKKAD